MARKVQKLGGNVNVVNKGNVKAQQFKLGKLEQIRFGSAIYPVDAPLLPSLYGGSAFIQHAEARGEKDDSFMYELIRSALRDASFVLPVETASHQTKDAKFLPGHLWGAAVAGPRPAKIMIINKNPWNLAIKNGRCFGDEDGSMLMDLFEQFKMPNVGAIYVTNLVKFMPPNGKTTFRAQWVKDGAYLLAHEIKIVRPDFILCLGTDASKALLGDGHGVNDMLGKVVTYKYNTALEKDDVENSWHEARVMTVVHPRQTIRDQSAIRSLETGIAAFVNLTSGKDVSFDSNVEHNIVSTLDELIFYLSEIDAEYQPIEEVIAVDAEWHGQHPVNKGSYMRTMQIAWKPKKAIGIVFHHAGGAVNEELDVRGNSDVNSLLNAFFKGGRVTVTREDGSQVDLKFKRKRVVGHFFNADLEWLVEYGIDIQECFSCKLYDLELPQLDAIPKGGKALFNTYFADGFKPGETVPAWYRTKYEGGADTGLMCHAIEETANYKLELLAARYLNAPRYDTALQTWKVNYCKKQGLSSEALEGYGECPDETLLPYGMWDADVTLRLYYKLNPLLDSDYDGNCCREAFWESQIATPAVLDIHRSGMTLDKARVDFLTVQFIDGRNELETKIREKLNWPDFNIRSLTQMREALFGHKLNGKKDATTGAPVRTRPADAISLNLMPLYDTSQPPKPWEEIRQKGIESQHSPCTSKQVLSILAENIKEEKPRELIRLLRDHRFLDQALKTVLRPPTTDPCTQELCYDADGNLEYDKGLASFCCSDGKIRTHIYQTKETGRWSSARPNIQNISKKRDPDFKRLLGTRYKYKLRSLLKASPGHVLIEADYVGAELFGMAVMAGDAAMIDHAKRNQLPEEHPDFYDIHSNVAVNAFKLKCPPTKTGLKQIEKLHLRIVAKSVIFGIAYGRGAKAISIAAKEEGIDITVDEAKSVIKTIFDTYPKLIPFFEGCKERARGYYTDENGKSVPVPRYLCNCFGRFRRFPDSSGVSDLQAEFERQAMNFPIQSMIASVVSRALGYLMDYRDTQIKAGHNMFRLLLQVHDAILLEVPYRYVKHVCEYVLPTFMRKAVPIYPTYIAGSREGEPTGDGPYYLGIEGEVMQHWGEKVTDVEAKKLGLPTGQGIVEGCVFHYSSPPKVAEDRPVAGVTQPRAARNIAPPEPYVPGKFKKKPWR